MDASGDSRAYSLFSFYVTQHHKHPAGTGLPGLEKDGKGRRAAWDEAGCWQHPSVSVMGSLTPAQWWGCVPTTVPFFNHLKYPHSLHRARELPVNPGQPHEYPPRRKCQQCLFSIQPEGALVGSALDGSHIWLSPGWQEPDAVSGDPESTLGRKRKLLSGAEGKKGKSPKGETSLHPGSDLCQCFSRFHFRNNQPLIIKSMLLGKCS